MNGFTSEQQPMASYQPDISCQAFPDSVLAILDNLSEGIIGLDTAGCFTLVNRLAEQWLGQARQTLMGRSIRTVFSPEGALSFYQQYERAIAQQASIAFEDPHLLSGRVLKVRLVPSSAGVMLYLQDVTAEATLLHRLNQQAEALLQAEQHLQAETTERQRVETLLRQDQDFFKAVLDNLQAGILACNAEGVVTFFNQATRQFYGLPKSSLTSDQWAEDYNLYLPDGKTPMNQEEIPLFRALQGQSVQNVEMVVAPREGAARTLLASGQAITTPEGKKLGAVVVMHDITDRKQVEVALRQREAQLSSIFQTIPDGIVILDRQGQIVAANRAAEKILRLSRSDLAERTYNDPNWIITDRKGQPFPEAKLPFVRVIQTGEPVYGVEHAILHADGTRVVLSINASPLVDDQGQIINVITAVTDTTEQVRLDEERQQVESALRESEERYRTVIESVAEGIVLQHADGGIFTCNASAEQILGLTADQMMGRTSLDPRWQAVYEDGSPFPGELHPAMITLQTGEPQSNVTMGIRKPDGTLTWVSINTRPLFQAQESRPFATVVSFFEITERKQAEEKRVQLVQEQAARIIAEQAQQQSAFLAEASSTLASSLDYEQTLQQVAKLAVPHFADWCSVDLLEPDGRITRVAVAHNDPKKVQFGWEVAQRYPRHLSDGYGIAQVMQTGRSEVAPRITDEQLAATVQDPEYLKTLQGLGLRSCIIVPLQARGRILGTISFVFSDSGRYYNQADLSLAEDLTRRAAIAIDNSRLFMETQWAQMAAENAASRTARLQSVTAALAEPLSPVQVAEVIVEQSRAALGACSVAVVLMTPDQSELEVVKAVGFSPDLVEAWQRFSINVPIPLAEAVRTGQPAWVETRSERLASHPHLAPIYDQFEFDSWMSLPLITEGKSLGGILLGFKGFKQLAEEDRGFILALSRQCAQAISRAQLYEAERQARAEAEQANRLKDEFLAVLSHELRSPLNPILGWAGLLRSGRLSSEKTVYAIETIERNAHLQVQLIEDLLDVSRILSGKLILHRVPVNLAETIEAAKETVQLAADAKTIQIHTQFSPQVGQVLGDPARLQQIVWNLLSNAIKFTPAGGQVYIQLEPVAFENLSSDHLGESTALSTGLDASHPLSYAQITVIDTGKGIQPNFLPHVFDTFRQADSTTTRTFGGLGLGLAIVRHLVELHGGTVQALSCGEDQGSTFIVRLPCLALATPSSNASPTQATGDEPAAMGLPLKGLQVLLVDDDTDTRDVTAFILEQAGAVVTPAASVLEALAVFSSARFDLLLSDIGMPERDGYALIQQIRAMPSEQDGQILAIALTAYAGEINQKQALNAGFQRHLAKPVDPDELVETVSSLIRESRL